jgi:hypothetical protein
MPFGEILSGLHKATVFLRSEFQDAYSKFTSERHLFTAGIADFQEDTLMVLEMCKDMEIWYEKSHQEVERIDYIMWFKRVETPKSMTFGY